MRLAALTIAIAARRAGPRTCLRCFRFFSVVLLPPDSRFLRTVSIRSLRESFRRNSIALNKRVQFLPVCPLPLLLEDRFASNVGKG